MVGEEEVAVEEPLELRLAGTPLITVMRSPGDDAELARGLLLSEGFVTDPEGVVSVSPVHPATLSAEEVGNVMEVVLRDEPAIAARTLAVASSCGVCGKRAIAELELRASPICGRPVVSASMLAALPNKLRAAQPTFSATGGVHAAGLFSLRGEALCVREDVGRHNTVDKIIGWASARGRLPLSDTVLCVSGRAGFEIAQKCVVAGIPVLVAVGAPTTLAIDVAERFRLTLCAFARGTRVTVYSHRQRVSHR